MKNILFLVVFSTVSASLSGSVFAKAGGGGTVVGNGAGFVEGQFQQAYYTLKNLLADCIQLKHCDLTEEEYTIALNIEAVLQSNVDKKDRLVFISEKANPGFFTTGEAEQYRIAKTLLHPHAAIYVNTDMLYKVDGVPAVTFFDINRVLIHELGHQTGIRDHSALDLLGVKIAESGAKNTAIFRFKISDEHTIAFSVTNYELAMSKPVITFNWKNSTSDNLSNLVIANSQCLKANESVVQIKITNGHFDFHANQQLCFKAWVEVSCLESSSRAVNTYKKNLTVDMNTDYKVNGVLVD